MKKLIGLLICVAALVALISCGGDGGPKVFSRAAMSVQDMQRYSLLSMANSGLGFIGFGGAGTTGGSTGMTTGGIGGGVGPGGYSSIGGFLRNFGGPNGSGPAMVRRALGAGTTTGITTGGTGGTTTTGGDTSGGTTGGGGGTGGQYFYFDEWLQLWVDTQWSDTTFTSSFYLDEAKAQPAGHATSTFSGDWTVFPQAYTSEYAFTAGSLAGSHGTYNSTQTSEFDGSMVYNNTYSDTSHDQGSASWSVTGSTWQSTWNSAGDKGWYRDSGDWNADGSGTYSCSASTGWSSVWHYHSNGSGSAHFEGPDPKLPADLTWTAAGEFKIVFADGSSETWNWSDLWDNNGEGTSGSNGLTTGGTTMGSTATTGDGTTGSTTGSTNSSTGTGTTGTVGGGGGPGAPGSSGKPGK
jgi:hypothetical protein